MAVRSRRVRLYPTDQHATVTPLELFFDLVFVFALVQVTAFMAADLSWHGVLRGLLVLALLWWSWVCYSWLGNVVKADAGTARPAMFGAMATMFVLAVSIPEAYADLPGGVSGPVVVALCYFAVRVLHLVLFWAVAGDDAELRSQLVRFAPGMLVATALLLVAASTSGPVQTGLWAAAVLADYLGNLLIGADRWRLRSVAHFAERHGLILIIAFGESLLSIGVGTEGLGISVPVVIGAVLGLSLAATMWWAYFVGVSQEGEHAVGALPVARRPRVARDAYSYLHLPMLAGIVLVALGLKKVLEYAGDAEHALSYPLTGPALAALVGGAVLYLLATVGFTWRTTGRFDAARTVGALVLLGLLAGGPWLPALATLALLTVVMATPCTLEARLPNRRR